MEQEPSHWSERARLDLPPARQPRTRRKGPSRRNPGKILVITAVCVFCLGAIAAVLAWHYASEGRTSSTADAQSQQSVNGSADGPGHESGSPPGSGDGVVASTTTTAPGAASSTTVPAPSTTTSPAGGTSTTVSPPATTSPATATKAFEDDRLGVSFTYPASWVEFPVEQASELTGPPTVGIAVGDPSGADFGPTPASYIFFGAYEDPAQPAPPAQTALEEWAMMTEGESPYPLTTVDPLSVSEVNGVAAASKTYATTVQGRPLFLRVCFLSAGNCIYVFAFRAEEDKWETDQALFEAVLDGFTVRID